MNNLDKEVYEKIARWSKNRLYQENILLSDVLNYSRSTGVSVINWMKAFEMLVRNWDMSKPTYEEQSEEIKDFIRNLVK